MRALKNKIEFYILFDNSSQGETKHSFMGVFSSLDKAANAAALNERDYTGCRSIDIDYVCYQLEDTIFSIKTYAHGIENGKGVYTVVKTVIDLRYGYRE